MMSETRVKELASLWRRFRRARSGVMRDRLVETYLPLVRGVARRLSSRLPPNVDVDDLVSVGAYGLVGAVESFDPKRGAKFETYARKRVVGAMLDELRRQDFIPRDARERGDLLKRTVENLREALGREPSDAEIGEAMGVSSCMVREILLDLAFAQRVPLDDDESAAWSELTDAMPEPYEAVFHGELLGLVDRQLSTRERALVQSYYVDEHSMKRIGHHMRLSESRICQMHTKLLNRLKERLHHELAP